MMRIALLRPRRACVVTRSAASSKQQGELFMMKSVCCTQLALFALVCNASAQSTGQDVRKLTSIAQKNYAVEDVDLYLGGSDVSPVNGHLFQAVLVKSDDAKPVYDYYLWELDSSGEKVQEWLIRAGISNESPFPSHIVPALRILPDGNILSVTAEVPGNSQIVRFDVNRGMISKKPLPDNKNLSSHFEGILPARDGHAFIIGSVRGKPTIVKTDEQGQVLFEKGIDIGRWGICSDGVQLSENRFRICGVTKEDDTIRSWVVDVDDQGEMQGKFLIDNAAWVSLPRNLRLARLGSDRTAFVHPVTADGRTYCHVTALDDALKTIAETRLCEVPAYVGEFHVQRYGDGLVIAVQRDPKTISVYVVDGNLRIKAEGVAEPLSPGVLWNYRLAVNEDRALVLAQRGVPLKKKSHTIDLAVFGLGDNQGQAPP
jgi:hypothetical protein